MGKNFSDCFDWGKPSDCWNGSIKSNVEIGNQQIALVIEIMRIVHEFEGNQVYLLVARWFTCHSEFMAIDSEKIIHAKIAQLEADIASLRDGYMIVNKRYAQTLDSMKLLTQSALEAALRAANAAEKAAQASKNAAAAAMASASAKIIDATHAATEAASLAAVAAAEAAAAASAAAAAAASAAAIQAEESSNQASAEAARATMRATEAAAEAAQMAHMASEAAKSLK
jgi:hypothetical protein